MAPFFYASKHDEIKTMEDLYLWSFFAIGMLAAVQWLPMPGDD